jgi:hypothetical protein
MRITLNWKPTLEACPDQWIDFCEALELPSFINLCECYEPESGGCGQIEIETKHNRPDDEQEKELRIWIAEIGQAEEGDVLAFVAGCSNAFEPATRGQLQEIIEEMESSMEADSFYQLFDHQRKGVEDTLNSAKSALDNFDTGDETWIGQDDDGYWFRYLPRKVA